MPMRWSDSKSSHLLFGLAGWASIVLIALFSGQANGPTNFMLLYLVPVSTMTWLLGRLCGVVVAMASTIMALSLELVHMPAGPEIRQVAADGVITFFVFATAALWLSRMKNILKIERNLARTDFTTGALNKRCFCEMISMEIKRFKRYRRTFSVAMIDLDNFKEVNDRLGHQTGDDVLHEVVATMKSNLRDTDIVARLGGDEFALLLTETDAESARIVVSHMREKLVAVMRKHHYPVTFSMGVMAFEAVPSGVQEVLRRADDLMYKAKREGKNTIRYNIFKTESTSCVPA